MDAFLKRLLTVVVALFLLCYVGFQAFQIMYSPIETETVYSYSVYETVDTEGFILRNEKIIAQNVTGYIYYTAENGSRVAKDGDIAYVYESKEDAYIQQQIYQINTEIEQLQSIQSQGTSGRVNLDMINKQISSTLGELIDHTHSASFSNLYDYQEQLQSLLNKRQVTIGKTEGFDTRIASLVQKREDLKTSLHPATATVTSKEMAGYFVSRPDGYEETLDYSSVTSLMPENIEAALQADPAPIAQNAIGKVVGDYEWYLACVLPVEKTADITVGASMTIKLPFVSKNAVPVTVTAMNREGGDRVAVIFKCTYMSKELSSIRKESIQIQVRHHEGLRVPTSAVRTNDNHETGVFIQSGNTVSFRRIEVKYSTTDYMICKDIATIQKERPDEAIDQNAYLRLYDELILGGKGLYDGKTIH